MTSRERFKKENGYWPNRLESVGYSLRCKINEGLMTEEEALDILMKELR